MTLLGEKLEQAGLDPLIVRLNAVCALFINNGRSEDEVHRLVRAAYAMSRRANSAVPRGHMEVALPRLQNGSAGQHSKTVTPKLPDSAAGRIAAAPGLSRDARALSENREERGHGGRATSHHAAAPPPREPSRADRAAAAAVAKESAVAVLTIFDRYKVRDGRPLKKLRFHELMKLAQEDETEARAFRYMVADVESKVANPDRMALVSELVSTEVAEKAFAFAKVAANAQ